MSLESLKQQAAALDDQSRKELVAFLLSLREKQWQAYARASASKLDDPNPDRWLTFEDFQARLAEMPEPPE